MKSEILTADAPAPIGPYSQGIVAEGKSVYVSMQIPLSPDGVMTEPDIKLQTARVIDNMKAILHEAHCDLSHVVKVSVYLKSLKDFAAMNEAYAQFFDDSKPARTVIEVSGIPRDALVAADAVAVL